MANELNLTTGTTGQTVVAQLLQDGAQVGSDISCPELTGHGGAYSGDVPDGTAPGLYRVLFLIGGVAKGGGDLSWDGFREVTPFQVNQYPPGPLQRV